MSYHWKQATVLMKLIAQGGADVAAGRTLSEKRAFERAELTSCSSTRSSTDAATWKRS